MVKLLDCQPYLLINFLNCLPKSSVLILINLHKNAVSKSAFLKIGRHHVELIHIPSTPPPVHFQLHGHVHEKRPNKIIDRQLNLCVEVWVYKPVSEKALVSLFDRADRGPVFQESPHWPRLHSRSGLKTSAVSSAP